MAYINFDEQEIVVLNGFEAAAYIASRCTNDGEPWCESEFDLLMEHGINNGYVTPLNNGVFRDWYVTTENRVVQYKTSQISDGSLVLYYVPTNYKGDYRALESLKRMFGEVWLKVRTYYLFSTQW